MHFVCCIALGLQRLSKSGAHKTHDYIFSPLSVLCVNEHKIYYIFLFLCLLPGRFFFSLLNAFLLTNKAKILVSDGATSSPGFLVPFSSLAV